MPRRISSPRYWCTGFRSDLLTAHIGAADDMVECPVLPICLFQPNKSTAEQADDRGLSSDVYLDELDISFGFAECSVQFLASLGISVCNEMAVVFGCLAKAVTTAFPSPDARPVTRKVLPCSEAVTFCNGTLESTAAAHGAARIASMSELGVKTWRICRSDRREDCERMGKQ